MQRLQRLLFTSLQQAQSSRSCCQKLPWWKDRARDVVAVLFASRLDQGRFSLPNRGMTTETGDQSEVIAQSKSNSSEARLEVDLEATLEKPRHIKRKALTKTAAHIMQIINKELVEEVKSERSLPYLRPGDVVQLKVETPENKRRISTFRALVMGLRRSGYSSTFRIRRYVAGVGVELVLPLYSPNIKELKVLDHRKVRRNKLYYLRDKVADKTTKIT